ncbi:MAG TPA: helix-turn-helix domain-containing protein [Candidatus Avalokitesvara rifleensis]|uniref:helix-turn-helix domain-containing protein n=1 Tax=Candidatus Avalokitesvara rifleensis TaxID=3367620 RepID=UPI002713647A|nr:LexA family transcriptional regulator [Candidatus Brocadiales bacterium]
MYGIADRIRRVLEEKSLSQRDLSKILDFTPGYINDILRGRTTPSIRVVERMTRAFNVSADWLLTGEEPIYDEKRGELWPRDLEVVTSKALLTVRDKFGRRKHDFVAVPILNDEMVSKLPKRVKDVTFLVPEEYCVIPHTWVKRPRTTFCYRVNGICMEPTVPHDSLVAADCSNRAPSRLNGKLCLIRSEFTPTVRRLRITKTHLVFATDNPFGQPKPIHVEIGTGNPIIGKVEWACHLHK